MPAAAASLASRQRRNGRRGGLAKGGSRRTIEGRPRSQIDLTGNSPRNLGRSQAGSQRSLTGSLTGSLTSGTTQPSDSSRDAGEHGGPLSKSVPNMARSMPTLFESMATLAENAEDRDQSDFMDSISTNPELFLTPEHEIEDDESSSDTELWHRPKPKIEEQGGPQNVQQGEETPTTTTNNCTPQIASSRTKDTFNENTATESTTPADNHQWPSWLRSLDDARKFIGAIVNDYRVENTVLLLITINAVMMGVATFPLVKENPHVQDKFETVDTIFLILFTIECAMQVIYNGWTLFKDGFLTFDLLIVIMSWALVGAQVFRAFRILRAVRLITRIQTLKNLVSALFSVVPKMTAIFMLLFLIFYISSVLFTTLFKGMYEEGLVEEPYFESIYSSLFTLFQMMTLDEWAMVLIQIQNTRPWAWFPFVGFIIITGFVVVNLIIAVICDAVHVMGEDGNMGLQGLDSDNNTSGVIEENEYEDDMNHATYPVTRAELRFEELQQQLDEMILVQDQMRITIEALIQQLRENGIRESASLSEDSERQILSSRTLPVPPPADFSGEPVSRSRTLRDRACDGDLGGVIDSKTM